MGVWRMARNERLMDECGRLRKENKDFKRKLYTGDEHAKRNADRLWRAYHNMMKREFG